MQYPEPAAWFGLESWRSPHAYFDSVWKPVLRRCPQGRTSKRAEYLDGRKRRPCLHRGRCERLSSCCGRGSINCRTVVDHPQSLLSSPRRRIMILGPSLPADSKESIPPLPTNSEESQAHPTPVNSSQRPSLKRDRVFYLETVVFQVSPR